jgi:simple sugar transport system ATP-binding protein
MDEVRENADVVTVMRRGELLFTKEIDRSEGAVVEAQVVEVSAAILGAGKKSGEDSSAPAEPLATPKDTDAVLTIDDVWVGRALRGVSLEVKAGEIVGIAGVEGNGQRELVEVIAGDTTPERGKVRGGSAAIIREDRHAEGLVLDATLRDNIVLGELGAFTRWRGILDLAALDDEAKARIERSGAPTDLDRTARTLSGGNQQKIVVARNLARLGDRSTAKRPPGKAKASVLIAAQPTRGVDLGASKDIHARLRSAARDGAGVLVLSADLDELRSLCHRILVIARGKIIADLPPTATDEQIGKEMLGLSKSERTGEA